MMHLRMAAALLAVLIPLPVLAGSQVFSSAVEQTGLLELYTSEGCSSCPPADRWLSSLKTSPVLWKEFIPVAFHVDYWDYIGWQDRFASPEFSERQRRFARQQSLRTVYTPGFVYNGREWRNWFAKRFFDFPQGSRPGVLTVTTMDGEARLNFRPSGSVNSTLFYTVALLGFDLQTHIKAGENAGRSLQHDFVVLDIRSGSLQPGEEGYSASTQIPHSDVVAPRYAIVVWIHQGDDISPIQATGGYRE
jgi:hypothetical protein